MAQSVARQHNYAPSMHPPQILTCKISVGGDCFEISFCNHGERTVFPPTTKNNIFHSMLAFVLPYIFPLSCVFDVIAYVHAETQKVIFGL